MPLVGGLLSLCAGAAADLTWPSPSDDLEEMYTVSRALRFRSARH